MNIARVLVTIGGVAGLSMAMVCAAEPPPATPEPAKDQPATPTTPSPAAPAVPSKDAQPAEPARNISKEAAELLTKVAAAGKAVKDLSANTEIITNGEGGDGKPHKGKIVGVFADSSFPLSAWRIEPAPAKAGEPAKVFAYDGKTVRAIDPEKKEMTETPAQPGMGFPMGEEGNLLPMWFMMQRQDMMAMVTMTVTEQVIEDANAKIGDEKVVVVRQVRSATLPAGDEGAKPQTLTETVRLSLGADNLPRRAERMIEIKGGDENHKQQTIQSFSDLKVNASPAADTFALKAPEGYKTREVKPQDDGTMPMTVKEGDAALDFALKDADGKEYKLADFKGKVVLLDFWATWCGPCKQAMPHIQKIHEAFKDKAVAVIGVNTWEKGEKAGPEYMAKQNFTYLTLLKGDDLAKSYGISGIPTLILIDKDGKILHTAVGFGPGEEEELTKLINEKLK